MTSVVEGRSKEDYLAAVLEGEVSARNASGAEPRIRAVGFGSGKPSIRQPVGALASGGFLAQARNVVLLGPPGTGKTHLATALGIVAARPGHPVLFVTATDWVTRLTDAHRHGQLPAELEKLRRFGLIIVDEVGSLPFEQDAANLFIPLVSSRNELASLILISNLPFSSWRWDFCDQAVAAAMIDRIVHHADVLTLKRSLLTAPRTRHRQTPEHQKPRPGRLNTQRTGGLDSGRRIGLIFGRCRHVVISAPRIAVPKSVAASPSKWKRPEF